MRVVIKHPGDVPTVTEIGTDFRGLQRAVGGTFASCLTCEDDIAWCDDDACFKNPRPALNVYRDTDGAPIYGTIVVTGLAGDENASLTDEQVARWMYLLTRMCATERDPISRQRLLAELHGRLSESDRMKLDRSPST